MSDDTLDEILDVNPENLKIREIEAIEEEVGVSFDVLFGDGAPRGRALRALAWITKRRTDPEFTFEQAGDLVIRMAGGPDPQSASSS